MKHRHFLLHYETNSNNGDLFPLPNIDEDPGLVLLNYFMIGLASCIFLHSLFIHKKKIGLIRILTDIFVLTMITSSIILLHCLYHPNRFNMAYLYNFGYVGIIECVQTCCNVTLTYSRHLILHQQEPTWKKYCVCSYIVLILLGTWVPFYTLLPIFMDVNSPKAIEAELCLYVYIYLPGTFLFNFYFTGQFVLSIYKLRRIEAARRDRRLEVIAVKSVVHSLLSCGTDAVFIVDSTGLYACAVYMIVHVLVLHCLFNVNSERFCKGCVRSDGAQYAPNAVSRSSEQSFRQGLGSEIVNSIENLNISDQDSLPSISETTWSANVELPLRISRQQLEFKALSIAPPGYHGMAFDSAQEDAKMNADLEGGAEEAMVGGPGVPGRSLEQNSQGWVVRGEDTPVISNVVLRHSSQHTRLAAFTNLLSFRSEPRQPHQPRQSAWHESSVNSDLTD